MSAFTENLIVSPLPDGKSWVLRKQFSYDVGAEGSGERVRIPVGFITDFASVPRLLWIFIPPWGKYGNAAVLHDYLYWNQAYKRKRADEIFLEAMQVLQVSDLISSIIFWAVRIFGGIAWKGNARSKTRGVKKYFEPEEESLLVAEMNLKGFLPPLV